MLENSVRFRFLENQGQAYAFKDTAPVMGIKDVQIAAGNIRSNYVPRDPYQTSVYLEKANETERYFIALKNNELIVDTDYTYLVEEIGVTKDPLTGALSTDVVGVARAVWRKKTLFRHVIDPKIESSKQRLMKLIKRKNVDDSDYLEYIRTIATTAQATIQSAVDMALKAYVDSNPVVKVNPFVE